jgi:hypothetical protein
MAIRDLTQSERLRAAIAEARKLADSGAYHDYTDIEYVLRCRTYRPCSIARPYTAI